MVDLEQGRELLVAHLEADAEQPRYTDAKDVIRARWVGWMWRNAAALMDEVLQLREHADYLGAKAENLTQELSDYRHAAQVDAWRADKLLEERRTLRVKAEQVEQDLRVSTDVIRDLQAEVDRLRA